MGDHMPMPVAHRLATTLYNSTTLSDNITSSEQLPSWIKFHPHDSDSVGFDSGDLSTSIHAIVYGLFTTILVVLFSLFWQLQRKIAYYDWVRNYKPSKLKQNGCVSGAIRPPTVAGHFLLGNGREFAEDAAGFLQRVGREYGDIATIRLMFRRIAVLTDVHSFPAFGHEPRFDFRPIVDQVNLNVFGFKVANVDDHKRRLMSFYKSSRMQDTVLLFDENLTNSMATYDKTNKTAEVMANDFVIDTGFAAVFRTILGGDASEECLASKDYALFYSNYKQFMKYFNFLWLGLPLKMFPAATKALQEMARVHPSVSKMPDDEGVCGYLRKACEAMMAEGHKDAEIIGHNVEFIHVHINAIRLAYWMLLFTLSDPVGYETLLEEIDELVRQRRATSSEDESDNTVCLDLEDIERLTTLDSIFTETLRLVSGVLVIRGITQDVNMTTSSGKTYELRRGESILFYPPAHHYDAEIFEDPTAFKWDRFIGATFSKNGKPVSKPVMGFGTLCIGQRFATYLTKWYLVRIMYRWRMQLAGPVPQVDLNYQGHEVLPPKCDSKITYAPRPESYGVRLQIALSRSSTPEVGNIELGNMVACQTTTEDLHCSSSLPASCN